MWQQGVECISVNTEYRFHGSKSIPLIFTHCLLELLSTLLLHQAKILYTVEAKSEDDLEMLQNKAPVQNFYQS